MATPRRNVPLRTTTSWKQTPQAPTAILTSRGPGSRAATSATRRTDGGPVRSATTARIGGCGSVRAEPAGDDLPLAAFCLHDRTRQRAGVLGCREGQRRHQAGIEIFEAFERADDRGFVGLATGALEHLGEDLARLVAMHTVGGRLGVGLVFL